VPTDNTVDIDRDVVLGLNHLPWDTSQLDLDVFSSAFVYVRLDCKHTDNSNSLGTDIDFD